MNGSAKPLPECCRVFIDVDQPNLFALFIIRCPLEKIPSMMRIVPRGFSSVLDWWITFLRVKLSASHHPRANLKLYPSSKLSLKSSNSAYTYSWRFKRGNQCFYLFSVTYLRLSNRAVCLYSSREAAWSRGWALPARETVWRLGDGSSSRTPTPSSLPTATIPSASGTYCWTARSSTPFRLNIKRTLVSKIK